MHRSLIFIQCLLFIMITSSLTNNDFSIADDLEATESFNEIKLSRNKRGSCDTQEALEVSAKLLAALSSASTLLPNPIGASKLDTLGSILEAASHLASFSGSVFGFQSPSTCDLDAKLDQILAKLKEIAETVQSIGHLVQCTQIKQNYRELSTKLITLLNIYEAFYRAKDRRGRENVRTAVISRCNDHTEGVHQIYSLFQIILSNDEVVDFFKNCAHYESEKVHIWSDKVKILASLITIVIKGCEEASKHTTQFDPPRFEKEVTELIRYYSEITNLKEFVKDQGVLGLRSIVKTIANRGKSADETAQTLKAMFAYFDWDVIFYSSEISGTRHTTLYSPDSTYCGSQFYSRELDHGRNALVAWCIPNHKNPHSIIGDCSTRSTEFCANYIRDNNKYLNYVLAISEVEQYNSGTLWIKKTPIQLDYNRIGNRWPQKSTDKRKFIYYDPGEYTFVNFASWMVWKRETAKLNLTNTALIFEHGLKKVITKYNTSLSGHYKQYTEKSDYQCFQACKYEEQCAAATFYAPYVYNCFFFGEYFIRFVQPGWTAYIKDTGMDRQNPNTDIPAFSRSSSISSDPSISCIVSSPRGPSVVEISRISEVA